MAGLLDEEAELAGAEEPEAPAAVVAAGAAAESAFASAFASARGGSGRKLRPPTASPWVQLETGDKTIAAFAGSGGRKFREDLPQRRHQKPCRLDRAISRRVHQPPNTVV